MAVEAQLCPQCGAAVQFGAGQTEVVCSHCGTTVVKGAAPGAPSVEQEREAEKLVQATARQEERLQSHGRPATGKLVSAQPLGIFRQTAAGRAVLMSVTVEVQPDGEPPFNAEAKVLVDLAVVDKYKPGTLLDVRFDPQDRTQVSIEGRPGSPEEQARRQQAKEQARQQQAKEEPQKRWAREQRWKAQEAQRAEQGQGQAPVTPTATPLPAWGGPRHAGGVPVPQAFDGVSSLGPATAVFERDPGTWPFPSFGPPKPTELVLYRDGFAFHSGKDLHTWQWADVAVIVSDLTTVVSSRGMGFDGSEYTLSKSSGEKVILDDRILHIRTALGDIKEKVFPLRLPALVQAYDAGQALTFGPVTVHKQNGLQLDGKLYPWDTILDIKVDSGRFKITLRDEKKHEARAAHIPNIELLGHLIGLKFYESSLAYY